MVLVIPLVGKVMRLNVRLLLSLLIWLLFLFLKILYAFRFADLMKYIGYLSVEKASSIYISSLFKCSGLQILSARR